MPPPHDPGSGDAIITAQVRILKEVGRGFQVQIVSSKVRDGFDGRQIYADFVFLSWRVFDGSAYRA
jgi:hypothetical protein